MLPGFIDLHVHGGDGADCHGAAPMRCSSMARFHAHARHHGAARDHGHRAASRSAGGVSAASARRWPTARSERRPGCSGRISKARSSARRRSAPSRRSPSPPISTLVDELAALAPIRVATMAPEIDPDGALLRHLLGARRHASQIGHTVCSYAQASGGTRCGRRGLHPSVQRHERLASPPAPGRSAPRSPTASGPS